MTHSLAALVLILLTSQDPPCGLDKYDVVWTTPSQDSSGSMPIGNGDLAANVWFETNGDLRLLISKSDAWSGNGRLLKLGGLTVKTNLDLRNNSEPPFFPRSKKNERDFRQELSLARGEIEVKSSCSALPTYRIRAWVDANNPCVRIELESDEEFAISVDIDNWRSQPREIRGREAFSAMGMQDGPHKILEEADTVLSPIDDRLLWFHRNTQSIYPLTMDLQGLGGLVKQFPDPLLGRTFGCVVSSNSCLPTGRGQLGSWVKSKHHKILVTALTTVGRAEDEWAQLALAEAQANERQDWERARTRHQAWWRAFWNRSWIDVSGPGVVKPTIEKTSVPLRIGADSHGEHRFRGRLGPVAVWDRALTTDEIAARTVRDPSAPRRTVGPREGLVVAWDGLDSPQDPLTATSLPSSSTISSVKLVDPEPAASAPTDLDGYPMSGQNFAEVASSSRLDLTSFTLAADIFLSDTPPAGVRILDKTVAGTAEGYLLDTYPGGSLRSIIAGGTLTYDAKLEKEKWYHVAATFDAKSSAHRLYLDGVLVAEGHIRQSCSISQAYALQRYVNACAGRGAYPIKFNGSLFTVDAREPNEHFDPDYRRWGGCYWFQNTRLPYSTMLAAGDVDMMEPFFRMYLDALPLGLARTQLYYQHGGAFFPETMFFWGAYQNEIYGWNRQDKPLGLAVNTYIRYYWSGALELLTLALDRWRFTRDEPFLHGTLLPLTDAIVNFYDQHYPRDVHGKIRFEPAASLETWHVAVNPLPEIAGLRHVLPQLLSLSGLTEPQRSTWSRLLGELPELPTKKEGSQQWLLPAEQYSAESNVENPELYAIWPYKLFGLNRPNLDIAQLTFDKRKHRGTGGWFHNAIQAACLGRASVAADMVVNNFSTYHAGSRFPAFWGPNYDWVPDQDHGAVGMTALQQMLLQWDGDRILLFPAWPKKWDVKFRLHAPHNTVIDAELKAGQVCSLVVTPAERAKDVTLFKPQ